MEGWGDDGSAGRVDDNVFFFFSSRRRHTRFDCDWSSDVCSSDLDYKTGRADEYDKANAADPFLAGTKLQLPVYVLAAAGAEKVQALYWFVSARGEDRKSVV